jgi:hypothetical protein
MGIVFSLIDLPPGKVFHSYGFHSPFPLNTGVFLFFIGSLVFPFINVLVLILAFTFILSADSWAWERNTHEEITEQAIRIMEGDLNSYLMNNLGLENGLNESVVGGTPRMLMIQGSNNEDDGLRSLNHFHEPITNSGLNVFGGTSAIEWSLKPVGAQAGGDSFSWNDARDFYLKALTSETKAERDEYWGKTFRALGQVMHLLQDSANPSHVRADLHPFDDGLHDYMERKSVDSYIGGGIFRPDPSMLEQVGATRAEPFSNLFDRNVYSGSNPQITLGTDIGVTEYTNANFFTDDTIPGQGSLFNAEIPYPAVTELVPAPIPSPYLTLPRLGSAAFPGARTAKLTGNQAVAKFLLTNTNLDLLGQLKLDDAVYEAHAQNLIPRAVGYSAAVLNYFFRGELNVIEQTYIVRAENLGGPFCNQTPADDFGLLDLNVEIPVESNFRGTGYFYYDGSNEKRVLFAQFTIPRSDNEFFNDIINPAEIPNPVPWNLVLEGQAGPGALEPRAIISKTGLAEWHYACVH